MQHLGNKRVGHLHAGVCISVCRFLSLLRVRCVACVVSASCALSVVSRWLKNKTSFGAIAAVSSPLDNKDMLGATPVSNFKS